MYHTNVVFWITGNKKPVKWTKVGNIEYRVQNNEDVEHQYVKMYFNTNKFRIMPLCGQHNKPHDESWFSNYYSMCFNPKLWQDTCVIYNITCMCNQCTSRLDKSWNTGVSTHQQPGYKPLKDFTYWNVVVYFNSWNIIQF